MEKTEVQARASVSINDCQSEQIHIPGSIQSFGSLIAFNRENVITRVSDNISQFTGVPADELMGQKLQSLISEEDRAKVAQSLSAIHQSNISLKLKNGKQVHISIHSQGEESFFDLFNSSDMAEAFETVSDFVSAISHAGTQLQLAQIISEEIRRITHFDRVKVYKFDENWNGEVIAESRGQGVPSYLGLHFPESDIPKQARELYVRNGVRVIADVNDKQSLILQTKNAAPLDLSFSFLRSVSPIHLQYLRNMDLSSSMSISLLMKGKLWGLVACHHGRPRVFDSSDEIRFQTISELCSNQLANLKEVEDAVFKGKVFTFIQNVMSELDRTPDLQILVSGENQLDDLIRSTGIAISFNREMYKKNAVPDDQTLHLLVAWLERGSEEVFVCDDLPSRFGQNIGAYACGLLAVKVPAPFSFWIMWFRMEISREVKWAGDPYIPKESSPYGDRLYPRTSFELWKEVKRGRSSPWEAKDIDAARQIARFICNSKAVQVK